MSSWHTSPSAQTTCLSERWGTDWAKVPEAELTKRTLWGTLASWLADVATIKEGVTHGGKNYDLSTAHGIWGGLIDSAKRLLSKSTRQETKARACVRICTRLAHTLFPCASLLLCTYSSQDSFTTSLPLTHS